MSYLARLHPPFNFNNLACQDRGRHLRRAEAFFFGIVLQIGARQQFRVNFPVAGGAAVVALVAALMQCQSIGKAQVEWRSSNFSVRSLFSRDYWTVGRHFRLL